jgi:HEAT repeat protein
MGSADLSVLLPVLSTAASDSQEEVRREAVSSLGRVARRAALQVQSSSGAPDRGASDVRSESMTLVRRLVKDRSSAVRTAAAEALAEFGPDPAAATDLIAAINDEDRAVRFAASVALLKVNGPTDPAAARTLLSLVADPDGVPDRPMVFEVLKGTSADVQDQATAALVALLSHGDPAVFADVIACLQIAGPRARAALPALEALLKADDPGLRASAGLAIVTIDGQETARSVATLIRIVGDPTLPQDARELAVPLLRGANSSALARATPDLIRQLADADAAVRQHAVSLLSMIIEDTRAELPVPTDGK